jgi:DNA-3-methyladenine glycosylase II
MEYQLHLKKDKKFAPLLAEANHTIKKRKNTPVRLMASIISQQLSTKVAAIIFKRFLALFDGKEPSCEQVLACTNESLRAIGLSQSKVHYIQNVAEFFIANKITDKQLYAMEPDDIIDLLTQIKGVGKWTVQMLMLFSLGQEDVFAEDDLGIQQAMIRLYKIKYETKKELYAKMLAISSKYSPYSSYACLHLWQWKDQGAI